MATLFSDDFNRANGALGSNWTVDLGNIVINTNQAYGAGSDSIARYNTAPSSADYIVSGDWISTMPGLLARCLDSSNFYLYHGWSVGPYVTIFKKVSGSWTQLDSGYSHTYSVGDRMKLEVQGTSLKAYINGTLAVSVTDSSLTSAGYAGIRCASGTIDNFLVESIGEASSSTFIPKVIFF